MTASLIGSWPAAGSGLRSQIASSSMPTIRKVWPAGSPSLPSARTGKPSRSQSPQARLVVRLTVSVV